MKKPISNKESDTFDILIWNEYLCLHWFVLELNKKNYFKVDRLDVVIHKYLNMNT